MSNDQQPRVWSVRGVPHDLTERATAVAKLCRMTAGEWVSLVVQQAVERFEEEGAKAFDRSRSERLKALEEEVAALKAERPAYDDVLARLAKLEGKKKFEGEGW